MFAGLRLFNARPTQAENLWSSPRQLYALLQAYYDSNGLYDLLTQTLVQLDIWRPGQKPLRNPVHRVVEFYPAHLWPGKLPDALPVLAANDKIIAPLAQVDEWSNWDSQKQVAARWFSLFGDLFIKVATVSDADGKPERVFRQLIKPEYVTDFDSDERGFLTYIRLDIPQTRREGDSVKSFTYTEVWSKANHTFRVWEHDKPLETPINKLGAAKEARALSDFGIDFVPFVHAKFRDVGEKRGRSAVASALDKIDEVNLMTTRLHQMLFRYNRATWALQANGVDANGRPLPPPQVGANGATDKSKLTLGDDDEIYRLPGNASITPLVPQVDYQAALSIIEAQMVELEGDLPEMKYYRLRDSGNLSGAAISLLLRDAIDKAIEARGNAEAALARSNAMALTIGKELGMGGFGDIGSFENGDFEHSFAPRPVISPSDDDKAETAKKWVDAGLAVSEALKRVGLSQKQIDDNTNALRAQQASNAAGLAEALLNNQRNFDSGGE